MNTQTSLLPVESLKTARARLLILVILVILPALGVQVFGAWSELQQNITQRREESLRAAEQAQGEFEAILTETRSVFVDLVRDPLMRSPNNCIQIFTSLRFAYERLAPGASNLGLADAAGKIYCAINPVQSEKNIAAQSDFMAAAANLDMSLGIFTANPTAGSPQVSVAYPVLSFDGKIQTVIFAIFETHWLETWQDKAALPAGAALTLLSPEGQVLWRSVDGKGEHLNGLWVTGTGWFTTLQTGKTTNESTDLDGVVRLNTLVTLNLNEQNAGYLHIGYPVAELYNEAYRDLYWKLGLLGLVFAAAMVLAWWGSETMFLHPLSGLMKAVERVQNGDLSTRATKVGGLGELTALAQSFDAMTDALARRETELRQSEARFRAAFESSAIGVGLLTLDGNILAVNAAVCEMSGYSEEELLKRNDRENVYPPDALLGIEMFEEMLAGKRSNYSVERRYVHKSGKVFWARVTLSLVRDPQGNPAYLVGQIEDIDQEKRTLANLQESEARFRAMFENAAIGISLIAPNGQPLAVNPVLVKISGRTEEELLELGGQQLTYEEDKEVGRIEFGEVLAGKRESYQVEKRYRHKDGRIQWMRQSVSAVRDAERKTLYLVVFAEDIDERKRAVEELRESEARFKAMYNNAAVGMAMMSLDRRIISVNETSARITGYAVEELIDTNPGRLSYPEDASVGMAQFGDLVAGKIAQFQMEKRFIRKNGEIFWGRVSYSAVPGKEGLPEYLVGLIEDITEEKEAERVLAESEARFRTLYDSAEMGIVLVDLGDDGNLPLDDNRFSYLVSHQRLNPAMQRMFGYTEEELQKIAISSLIHPADQGMDAQQFRQLITGEIDSYRVEKRFVRKDKSVFWGRLTDSLARTANGTPRMVIGIIEDINEERLAKERLAFQEANYRHSLEQRIAERTEELNLANERLREKAAQDAVTAERTRLARDLHDAVTQTLFSTTLIADVLPDIWEMNKEEGRHRLEEVRQLTRGALAEMRTLLVELRPNALVEVPLPTLLRQLTEATAGRSRINIQLSAEGERKLPAEVQIGLYRIAQEALNNVVKHSRASQAVATLRLGETVRLSVADNGAGFDPSTVTADHLGLKIMRERAEAIGATLTIYSEPGEGTQISVIWS